MAYTKIIAEELLILASSPNSFLPSLVTDLGCQVVMDMTRVKIIRNLRSKSFSDIVHKRKELTYEERNIVRHMQFYGLAEGSALGEVD
jgi:hypothetical protein